MNDIEMLIETNALRWWPGLFFHVVNVFMHYFYIFNLKASFAFVLKETPKAKKNEPLCFHLVSII